jgi:hypothetical protein
MQILQNLQAHSLPETHGEGKGFVEEEERRKRG